MPEGGGEPPDGGAAAGTEPPAVAFRRFSEEEHMVADRGAVIAAKSHSEWKAALCEPTMIAVEAGTWFVEVTLVHLATMGPTMNAVVGAARPTLDVDMEEAMDSEDFWGVACNSGALLRHGVEKKFVSGEGVEFATGDVMGLLLDHGNLSVYKNGALAGLAMEGFTGDLCWAVILGHSGTTMSIASRTPPEPLGTTLPDEVDAAEEAAEEGDALREAAAAQQARIAEMMILGTVGTDGLQRKLCDLAHKGDCEGIEAAIAAGCSVNCVVDLGITATPLLMAVVNKQLAAVRLLLHHEADPNILDGNGDSPLHVAAERGNPAILELLMDGGAEIDKVNTDKGNNMTAFHYACGLGPPNSDAHADCVAMLAQRGCDMTVKTKQGLTGLQFARRQGRKHIVERMRAFVAERLSAEPEPKPATQEQEPEKDPEQSPIDFGAVESDDPTPVTRDAANSSRDLSPEERIAELEVQKAACLAREEYEECGRLKKEIEALRTQAGSPNTAEPGPIFSFGTQAPVAPLTGEVFFFGKCPLLELPDTAMAAVLSITGGESLARMECTCKHFMVPHEDPHAVIVGNHVEVFGLASAEGLKLNGERLLVSDLS
eukprot:COSAG04_NODE_1377_length_7013_cov_1.709141_6_plen_601_part_00